jgi:PAT family beta-lactamase induction signal transducer AmpG
MADYIGWNNTYLVLAGLMGIGVIASFLGPDPQQVDNRPTTLLAAVVEPFREFISRPNAYAILLLIVLYKWADAFAFSLNTTFLLRELQFSLTEIGAITKGVGFAATLAGVFIGGILLNRLGLFRSLMLFGFAQAIANLSFLLLAMVGKDYSLMASAIFLENFCAGMGTTAFLAFLMSLCHPRYTATQFALFTALSAVGRVIVGPIAGMMVESIGWISFYSWAFVLAFPALILLWWLRHGFQINFQSSTPRITDDNQ